MKSGAAEILYSSLAERGLRGRVISVHRLQELKDEIARYQINGALDGEFSREALSHFIFRIPEDFPSAASLIIIAMPRPQTRVSFVFCGKPVSLILPPIYLRFKTIHRQIVSILGELLSLDGYTAITARLPQKLLAVRSGLAEYGRNNISYISGMGSFFQLAVFFSDFPCPEDHWIEPRMMAKCENCRSCVNNCPTGALTESRFLLKGERCLVFHNERSSEHPFPEWIDANWHNSLLGCMLCQRICPENNNFLEWFEGNQEFSEEESSLIVTGVSPDKFPPETREKLKNLGLLDYIDFLPRNLSVFRMRQS
ncbi:MAG: 4Fe-4S binding protein [Candidatus Riflebacteria bacterium]|nr:4Fe-4S binding protein [Candidatus Riflebacteria bacterium]